MEKYRIMAHNTMSYLKPRRWWMRPFRFTACAQNKSFFDLYVSGIRCFDIRVRMDKRGNRCFAHGSMLFKSTWTPDELFDVLNAGDNVLIRLVLEYNRPTKDIEDVSTLFKGWCEVWRKSYPNITFFEFRRKYDWKKLYTYDGEPTPTMHQAVGSMAGRKLLCWWPWLYAWLNNDDILAQGTDKDILSIDFIK